METQEFCKVCGAVKKWKEGGTRKDGTTWDGFMACPNYKAHPPKQEGNRSYSYSKPTYNPPATNTGETILLEEMKDFRKEFNTRFDALAEYLAKNKGIME